MTTNYVAVSPGTEFPIITLTVAGITGALAVPSLQDVTINNANDVFTWSQMNNAGKIQIATTSTNSISTNVVVEEATFFGATGTAGSALALGLMGLSREKTRVGFTITMGSKTIAGDCYITGLAPTVSADSPVWVTPVTLSVTGEYTVTTTTP